MPDRHRRRDPVEPEFCHYCKVQLTRRTRSVEHIVPLSKNGRDEKFNRTLACITCNQAKGDKWPSKEFCNCNFCRKAVRVHREAYNIKPPKR